MKFGVLLIISLVLFTTAFAADWELDKGAKQISGSINLNTIGGDCKESITFGIFTSAQVFIDTCISVGGYFSFASISDLVSGFFLGPKVNYYFGEKSKTIWPFISVATPIYVDDHSNFGVLVETYGGVAIKLYDHYAPKAGIYFDNYFVEGDWAFRTGLIFGFTGFFY